MDESQAGPVASAVQPRGSAEKRKLNGEADVPFWVCGRERRRKPDLEQKAGYEMAAPDPEQNEPDQEQEGAEARKTEWKVFVNSEAKEVSKRVLTYADVVFLEWGNEPPEGPNVQITITYKKAKDPHEGSLISGGSVEIKEGTRFSVRASDKS
jgi:hypothetical protein